MQAHNINASDIVKNLSLQIHLTGVGMLRVRLAVGCCIMRLAVWVIGCRADIRFDDRIGDESKGIYTLANTVEVGRCMNVFLDDVKQTGAVFCDVRNGIVRRHIYPFQMVDDEVVTETVFGRVRVEPV